MDELQSMRVFTQVAQSPGFAKAARVLRMSPPAVTKHVASLEARLGVRLFDRTTRRVSLTEAGRVYLERAHECLQAFVDADAAVSELAGDPIGTLRVTAPVDFAAPLGHVVGRFISQYPKVQLDLRLSNRAIDIVEEGIDVALRVGSMLDGRFIARPIAKTQVMLLATPAYLRKHGRPKKPSDLTQHRHLIFTEPRSTDELELERQGQRVKVKVKVALFTNSGQAAREVMLAGGGIGSSASFLVGPDVKSGLLEQVLPQWTYRALRLFAVYPHRRFVPAKVRVFIDALRAELGDGTIDPWLER